MKTILVLTNLLFLGAAIYFGYQFYQPTPIPIPPISTCVPCKDYKGTKVEGMPAELALLEVSNYKNNMKGWGDADSGRLDSRSVWFSLDTVKRFIWHIENELCKNKIVDKNKLGLRIYFGRYPLIDVWQQYDNDPAHLAKMKEYQNLHTLFMVPTYLNNKHNIDFDPRPQYVKTDIKGNQSEMTMEEIMGLDKKAGLNKSKNSIQDIQVDNKDWIFALPPSLNNTLDDGALRPPSISSATELMISADNYIGIHQ